jgi:hypothetical protein
MNDEEGGQAFAIPAWWKTSSFTIELPGSDATLFGDIELDGA